MSQKLGYPKKDTDYQRSRGDDGGELDCDLPAEVHLYQ